MGAHVTVSIYAAIELFRGTPTAIRTSCPQEAVGWCEVAMDEFVEHAHKLGVVAHRYEFNYSLRSAFPEPHPRTRLLPREDVHGEWDGWHHAAVMNDGGGDLVVDWTLRQFDSRAEHPHIEPLESYSRKFNYHRAME